MMKVHYLLMAGGTGGHVFPALAVAQELMARGATVSWLGTAVGIEAKVIPDAGITLHTITIKGFRGKRIMSKLMMPFLLLQAIMQAMIIIMKHKPNVVIGFGGFASGPGGVAARLLNKKLIVHEQNAIAGTTNKLLAKIAHQRLEAFPGSLNQAIHVGNPVRQALLSAANSISLQDTSLEPNHQPLHLLVMGGSLGAKAINELVPQALALLDGKVCPQVWHQTGKGKQQATMAAYKNHGMDNAQVVEFIDDVAGAYQWADVVICRSGALTVSEVAIMGLPAIFIPFPFAIDDHQTHNAQWLVNKGAAICIQQQLLNAEQLMQQLLPLLTQKQPLLIMSQRASNAAMPEATTKVADICEEIAHVH